MEVMVTTTYRRFKELLPGVKSLILFGHQRDDDDDYDDEDQKEHGYGAWQNNLPDDILSRICSLLNVEEFTRMRFTCKAWMRSSSLFTEQRSFSLAPQHPWLLYPQCFAPNNKNKSNSILTFMDIFEGKIRTMKLPEPVRGGWCCGSSKGWLFVANGLELDPDLFLVNPVSGQTLPLPRVSSIPGYKAYTRARGASRLKYGHEFINDYKISQSRPTADDTNCIVACIAFDNTAMAFCKIGATSWTLFGEPLNYDEDEDKVLEIEYSDMAFSTNNNTDDTTTLYVYFGDSKIAHTKVSPMTRTVSVMDEGTNVAHQLVVKIIPHIYEGGFHEIGAQEYSMTADLSFATVEKCIIHGYLVVNKFTGKLLVVHKICDTMLNKLEPNFGYLLQEDHDGDENGDINDLDHMVLEDHDHDEAPHAADNLDPDIGSGNPYKGLPSVRYYKTRGFQVISLDPDTGDVVSGLSKLDDDQAIILGAGGSFMVSSHDFGDAVGRYIQGNAIYFSEDIQYTALVEGSYVSREQGIFDLNTGKIKRCFPSVPHPILSNVLWFTPSPY